MYADGHRDIDVVCVSFQRTALCMGLSVISVLLDDMAAFDHR